VSRAAYDEIAGWYDEVIRSGPQSLFHDLVLPAVLELAGEVEGIRVCDLACGQGVVARALAERGAEVVGIDVSKGLLDIARRYEREELRGISYVLGDAQGLAGVEDASFDGVVCNLALMDIPDLEACLSAVARVLRTGGWFVFSVTHPCFQTPASSWTEDENGNSWRTVRGYFAEGFWRSDLPEGIRGRVGAYHRTLSTCMNALSGAGFALERLTEPQSTGRLAGEVPGYREVPPILVARCKKLRVEG
jgi:SAM-dependent methyltransferase